MFLIWPCFACVYSYSITKFAWLTLPTTANFGDPVPGSDEQLQRFQDMMNERAEQFEQRQFNFDEQNFRPVGAGEEVVVIDMNQAEQAHQEQIIMISQEDEEVNPAANAEGV